MQSLPGILVWTLASAACFAATWVNPYGWEIYEYASQTAGTAARRRIDEWLPPSWDQGIGIAWFLSLPIVIGVLGWSWKKGRRVSWREAFLLACFAYLAATSIRMVLWWLIVIGPMLCVRLADFWPRSQTVKYSPSRAAAMTVAGLLTMCVLSLPPLHAINPLLKIRAPDQTKANLDQALEFIVSRDPWKHGRIFAKLEWGEYIAWKGHPNWKIFMDGRIEIYPDDIWQEYDKFTRGDRATEDSIVMGRGYSYYIFDEDFHRRTGLLPKESRAINSRWDELWKRGNVSVYTFFTDLAP